MRSVGHLVGAEAMVEQDLALHVAMVLQHVHQAGLVHARVFADSAIARGVSVVETAAST